MSSKVYKKIRCCVVYTQIRDIFYIKPQKSIGITQNYSGESMFYTRFWVHITPVSSVFCKMRFFVENYSWSSGQKLWWLRNRNLTKNFFLLAGQKSLKLAVFQINSPPCFFARQWTRNCVSITSGSLSRGAIRRASATSYSACMDFIHSLSKATYSELPPEKLRTS